VRQQSRIEAVLRRRLGTARDVYRRGGVGAVALKVLLLLGYHRVILFEAILNPPAPPPAAGVPLEFGFLGRDGLDEIAAFRSDLSRTELEERFDRDERCFVARSAGEIVSVIWVHRHNVRLPGVGSELVVPPDAVYVCDSFTAPAMRGQRIAPALSREFKNRLAAEGVERWVSYVLGGNDIGLINAARGNARETSRVAAIKIGRLPPVRVPYLPRRHNP
jgi:GNAT superfamily N-acetyltransferase